MDPRFVLLGVLLFLAIFCVSCVGLLSRTHTKSITGYTATVSDDSITLGDTINLTVTIPARPQFRGVITATPSGGGLTSPINFVFTATSGTSLVHTLTPTVYGNMTLTFTNNSRLPNITAIPVTIAQVTVGDTITSYSITPSKTNNTQIAINYPLSIQVIPNGTYSENVIVTANGAGLTNSAQTLAWTGDNVTKTATFTATQTGTMTISFTNNGGLSNVANLSYPVTDSLAVNIISSLDKLYTIPNSPVTYTLTPDNYYAGSYRGHTFTYQTGDLGNTSVPYTTVDHTDITQSWVSENTAKTYVYTPTAAGTMGVVFTKLSGTNVSGTKPGSRYVIINNNVGYTVNVQRGATSSIATITPGGAFTGNITLYATRPGSPDIQNEIHWNAESIFKQWPISHLDQAMITVTCSNDTEFTDPTVTYS